MQNLYRNIQLTEQFKKIQIIQKLLEQNSHKYFFSYITFQQQQKSTNIKQYWIKRYQTIKMISKADIQKGKQRQIEINKYIQQYIGMIQKQWNNYKKNPQKQDQQKIQKLLNRTITYLQQYQITFVLSLFFSRLNYQQKKIHFHLDQLLNLFKQIIIEGKIKFNVNNMAIVIGLIDSYFDKTKLFLDYVKRYYNQNYYSTSQQLFLIIQQLKNLLYPKLNMQQIGNIKNIKNINISQRTQKFISIINNIYQFLKNNSANSFSKSQKQKSPFQKRSIQLLSLHPKNIFQQITINNLRQKLQRTLLTKNNTLNFCCIIFISNKIQFIKQQSKFHQHKNYHWPIKLQTIIKHVKKTIVGFLNVEGGVIYVGMKQTQKVVTPSGIALNRQEVVQFFEWMHQLCQSIFPQINQNKNQSYKENLQKLARRQELQQKFQYIINEYVSIQYLPIVDSRTYLDLYQNKLNQTQPKYGKSYLIRIKVKPGTKAQTFHLLKRDKQSTYIQNKTRSIGIDIMFCEKRFKCQQINFRLIPYFISLKNVSLYELISITNAIGQQMSAQASYILIWFIIYQVFIFIFIYLLSYQLILFNTYILSILIIYHFTNININLNLFLSY